MNWAKLHARAVWEIERVITLVGFFSFHQLLALKLVKMYSELHWTYLFSVVNCRLGGVIWSLLLLNVVVVQPFSLSMQPLSKQIVEVANGLGKQKSN